MQLQVSFLPRDSDGGPTRGRTPGERRGREKGREEGQRTKSNAALSNGFEGKEKPESQFDLVTVVRNE
ncbi:hypothetical protein A9P98_17980 [Cylindrospermopsis raciborskii CS-505]|uniref:Uncharacterized protein n=2 Tax=Cylindrospermopsis raciborskii TaxID=77022 RepID=A0A853MC12_9CYAN|nr:hypothetical protein A9P98_18050 [Cylindrospermopsis raciborskii CS-505]OBU74751.1 hypothetical protein A9P98_17980 [Cylindrospermopsis raciborskii CS-505]